MTSSPTAFSSKKIRRPQGIIIAIDGPAGSGKSSVGKLAASTIGYRFLNTGEMYRALTWKVLERGIKVSDEKVIMKLAKKIKWEFKAVKGPALRTFADGVVADKYISQDSVGRNSSLVAGLPAVRKFMRAIQRKLGKNGGIVMEGRDIGTNVFPDAEIKVYLDASAKERAERRISQLKSQGFEAAYKNILDSIQQRDRQDAQRRINPLKKAEDAVVMDTTNLTLKQVAGKIVGLHFELTGKRSI
ncbi:MAG: (d)CMP kinase [bacterium]